MQGAASLIQVVNCILIIVAPDCFGRSHGIRESCWARACPLHAATQVPAWGAAVASALGALRLPAVTKARDPPTCI